MIRHLHNSLLHCGYIGSPCMQTFIWSLMAYSNKLLCFFKPMLSLVSNKNDKLNVLCWQLFYDNNLHRFVCLLKSKLCSVDFKWLVPEQMEDFPVMAAILRVRIDSRNTKHAHWQYPIHKMSCHISSVPATTRSCIPTSRCRLFVLLRPTIHRKLGKLTVKCKRTFYWCIQYISSWNMDSIRQESFLWRDRLMHVLAYFITLSWCIYLL